MVVPGDIQVTPGFMNKADLFAGEGSDRGRYLRLAKSFTLAVAHPKSRLS